MTGLKSGTPKFNFDSVFDTELYMKFYSTALDERAETEFGFLQDILNLESTRKVLDLACGYGRHTNQFAKYGCIVTGIDKYMGFLDIAKKKAKEMNVSVEYIKQDMRELNYENEFDIITLLFTAFGYFSDEENTAVLERIFKALKSGGQFVLDIQNKDNILRTFSDVNIEESGEDLMVSQHTYEVSTGRMIVNRFYILNGKRIDASHFVRVYSFPEIKMILEKVGFKVIKTFGAYDKEITIDDPNARRVIILAQK